MRFQGLAWEEALPMGTVFAEDEDANAGLEDGGPALGMLAAFVHAKRVGQSRKYGGAERGVRFGEKKNPVGCAEQVVDVVRFRYHV